MTPNAVQQVYANALVDVFRWPKGPNRDMHLSLMRLWAGARWGFEGWMDCEREAWRRFGDPFGTPIYQPLREEDDD